MTRELTRARALLERSGAWIDGTDGAYAVRLGPDRRMRPAMSLDEAAFRALVEAPGLKARVGGGWMIRPVAPEAPDRAGRPGVIEGERSVMEADGRLSSRRANLGESPIAWLARRRDQSGRPWLSPIEAAAGERLRTDAEIAQAGPSLTMRWDALPRAGGGSAARVEPGDRSLAAGRRVAAALAACGPRLRPMVERVCVRGTSLGLAESELQLRKRQGKTVLKQGLQALAEHYGMG